MCQALLTPMGGLTPCEEFNGVGLREVRGKEKREGELFFVCKMNLKILKRKIRLNEREMSRLKQHVEEVHHSVKYFKSQKTKE